MEQYAVNVHRPPAIIAEERKVNHVADPRKRGPHGVFHRSPRPAKSRKRQPACYCLGADKILVVVYVDYSITCRLQIDGGHKCDKQRANEYVVQPLHVSHRKLTTGRYCSSSAHDGTRSFFRPISSITGFISLTYLRIASASRAWTIFL